MGGELTLDGRVCINFNCDVDVYRKDIFEKRDIWKKGRTKVKKEQKKKE